MPSSEDDGWVDRVREGVVEQRKRASGLARYAIEEKLGEGGAAVVYRARDRELGRAVALKILHDSYAASPTARERFQREAKISASVAHPNVVTVYDAGEADGRLYLVMELVEGRPLHEVLAGRAFEARAMVVLLEKVARGVAAAHQKGIVHRDLKPANVIVGPDGEPKVGDFGLAHIAGSEAGITRTGTVMGTPLYMAPEQVRGRNEDISPRTDVYAMGAILYELLTGRPPHGGESVTEIYDRILNEEPPAPRRLNARASLELQTIALKALEKDPARRYATAEEFGEDLRRHLEHRPILARPPGLISRTGKWGRRHRATSTGLAVALAAVVSVAGYLAHDQIRRREERWQAVASLLDRGKAARGRLDEARARMEKHRHQERRLSIDLGPASGTNRREELWNAQRSLDAATREADQAMLDAMFSLESALQSDASHPGVRTELLSFYYREFERAEESGDTAAAELNRRKVVLFDLDRTMASKLEAAGSATLESNPPGADIELLEFREGDDRRLAAVPLDPPCRGAILGLRKRAGSYLAILRKAGYRDVRFPFRIDRGRDFTATVRLYTEDEIGRDFVYIPAGRFIFGGDPRSILSFDRDAEATTDDFFIARFEAAMVEYYRFLCSVFQSQGREAAQRLVPRKTIDAGHVFVIPESLDRLEVPPGIPPRLPAYGISWTDATAFASWLSAEARARGERVSYRLPTEREWEKAARGADGRYFPWGDHLDWSFMANNYTLPAGGPELSASYPRDESPYGLLDMAGNMSEWCQDWVDERHLIRVFRGGGWSSMAEFNFHSANRAGADPDHANLNLGLRLVRVLER